MKPKMILTAPLVRDGDGELRETSWDDALTRAATGLARARAADAPASFGMFSCSKATNEMNFVAQKFARAGHGHEQHRLAATAPDTLPASSVWRRYSERAAARRPTARSRRRTSSSCGARTRGRRIPIFFHHVLKGVRNGARLFVGRPAPHQPRRSGPTAGSGSTSAPTSRSRTRWRARSSTPASHNRAFIEHATTRLRGVRRARRGVHARGGRAADGRPGRGHPRAGARLRARRPRA